MNDELIHERLRQILRDGDPASLEPGLNPDEVHTMRRTVLNATSEPRRRFAWLPVLVAGTAALILLALAFGPWHRRTMAPPAAPRMAAVPTPVPAPSGRPAPVVPSERPVKSPRRTRHHTLRPPRIPPAPPRDMPVTIASLPTVREIRFSTPGGTRIIWELPTNDAR